MHQGYVKAVVLSRGFGFISTRSMPRDVFFHLKDLEPGTPFDETLEGLRVEFEVSETDRGPAARCVRAAR